jgi:uncharacterized metal-binding protein YceD (DUF177 family)
MVSVNVAQLLQSDAGTVREFDFSEPIPDASDDLHLRGPVAGHATLIRTSRGILVRSEYRTPVALDCSRCLNDVQVEVEGSFEEEFLPSTDIRTGLPTQEEELADPDQPRIDDHHEIDLDDMLRQEILTSLPLQPLCDAMCPGLCPTCGQLLNARHAPHPEEEPFPLADAQQPFSGLAELLRQADSAPADEIQLSRRNNS